MNTYKISEWEEAIKHRPEIELNEIYLDDGRVRTAIGTVLVPTKHKVRGETQWRQKRVRWNRFGFCMNVNGSHNSTLNQYNIFIK